MVPTIDEFGGYSSRLRIPETSLNLGVNKENSADEASDSKPAKPRNVKTKAQNSGNQSFIVDRSISTSIDND